MRPDYITYQRAKWRAAQAQTAQHYTPVDGWLGWLTGSVAEPTAKRFEIEVTRLQADFRAYLDSLSQQWPVGVELYNMADTRAVLTKLLDRYMAAYQYVTGTPSDRMIAIDRELRHTHLTYIQKAIKAIKAEEAKGVDPTTTAVKLPSLREHVLGLGYGVLDFEAAAAANMLPDTTLGQWMWEIFGNVFFPAMWAGAQLRKHVIAPAFDWIGRVLRIGLIVGGGIAAYYIYKETR